MALGNPYRLCTLSDYSARSSRHDNPDDRLCLDGKLRYRGDKEDCTRYIFCYHGKAFYRKCPGDSVWSEREQRCDAKREVPFPCGWKDHAEVTPNRFHNQNSLSQWIKF